MPLFVLALYVFILFVSTAPKVLEAFPDKQHHLVYYVVILLPTAGLALYTMIEKVISWL